MVGPKPYLLSFSVASAATDQDIKLELESESIPRQLNLDFDHEGSCSHFVLDQTLTPW